MKKSVLEDVSVDLRRIPESPLVDLENFQAELFPRFCNRQFRESTFDHVVLETKRVLSFEIFARLWLELARLLQCTDWLALPLVPGAGQWLVHAHRHSKSMVTVSLSRPAIFHHAHGVIELPPSAPTTLLKQISNYHNIRYHANMCLLI